MVSLSPTDVRPSSQQEQRLLEAECTLLQSPVCKGISRLASVVEGQHFSAGLVSGLLSMEFHPPASDLSRMVSNGAGKPLRDALVASWAARHAMIKHSDLPKGVVGRKTTKICHLAGQCLCGKQAPTRQFHDELVKVLKQYFVPKSALRKGLKFADFVCRFVAGDQERWFHIAWINLNSWHMVFLPLTNDSDAIRCASAQPDHALVVDREAVWTFSWAPFSQMDLMLHWGVEFWMLWGKCAVTRAELQPWSLQVRKVVPKVAFWNGPPPPRRRAPASPRPRPARVVHALGDEPDVQSDDGDDRDNEGDDEQDPDEEKDRASDCVHIRGFRN